MSVEPYGPKTVGDTGIYVVGVEGVITATGDGTITIGGHTLPTRMSDTVKYLSVVWPDEDGDEGCLLEHCGSECEDADQVARARDRLMSLIEDQHNGEHPGAFRTCNWRICREAHR